MDDQPSNSTKPSSSMSSPVRVVLRVRPFLRWEIDSNGDDRSIPCVALLDRDCGAGEEVAVQLKDQWSSRSECYKLDSFFGQSDRIGQIFDREVGAVIPGVFRGLNATVFAYGATGSGKTYTMQGVKGEPGMIPLSMSTIFSMCSKLGNFSVEVAYYEIYMDRCYDLLEPKAKEIVAMDDKDGRVQLKGLSWVPIHSMNEFREVFETGVDRRKVGPTGLNDVSSRSHAVLAIAVTDGVSKGKLNLIDLAGNEDNRRSCNDGIRLQESVKINQSLFALSNVIYALNNNETRIPYRESKLTRILQDSLGGTSLALMIACLNPVSYQEAVHTVSLAARSRKVMNYASLDCKETPKVKIDMEAKLQAWLNSKGKNKSAQRILGPFSPLSSANRSKKQESNCSSSKRKAPECKGSGVLFNSVAPISANVKLETSGAHLITRNGSITIEQTEVLPGCDNIVSIRDNDETSATQITLPKTSNSIGSSFNKENLPFTPLDTLGSPAADKELHDPSRKALSPLPSNTTSITKLSSDDCISSIFLEPKTPKFNYLKDEFQNETPFKKFKASSSSLKESLIEEYLQFLNNASKEELMQLKGIGEKRAEYILELREEMPNPLKSLSDLENIGLSSKQVLDMFKRAATGILY
ncbi:kinesin-like protein KIN-10C isoform X2 [Zingiber officinale]|uniref:kinesin-like protein KIN-10C isoform X1 n=1 Tax=Zingiber officinale TaxID=94328 RepID=UPI001C4C9A84|nr:kinesin-like protein KIN-10C isoform X1 [Zingiber officinale]XP_042447100.1 kinesin-like protein KIN-10C isoform X2 [Zingiber officinale]